MAGQNRKNQLKVLFQPVGLPAAEGDVDKTAAVAPARPEKSSVPVPAAPPEARSRTASGA